MRLNVSKPIASFVAFFFVVSFVACAKVPDDTQIAEAIKASYYSNPELQNERVEVSVSGGEVTLSGEVSSELARLQAYKLANETAGVKKVNDLLAVAAPESPATETAQLGSPRAEPQRAPTKTAQSSRPKPTTVSKASPPPVENPPARVTPPEVVPEATRSLSPPAQSLPAPPPAPRVVTIPSGTGIRIQMIDSVDSETHRPGEKFQASLDAPIVVGEEVVIPKGADVHVILTDAKTAGKLSGRSELRLQLDRIDFQGKTYKVDSTVYEEVGGSRGKDTVKKTAIGAAIGTAIGAIAGGGKGAAIGAGVGAGGGTAVQVLTKGQQVKIPSETKLDFRLEQPIEVTLPPKR
ncbi:MAG: BON domain-containing protein [Acidobacteriota bacterium]